MVTEERSTIVWAESQSLRIHRIRSKEGNVKKLIWVCISSVTCFDGSCFEPSFNWIEVGCDVGDVGDVDWTDDDVGDVSDVDWTDCSDGWTDDDDGWTDCSDGWTDDDGSDCPVGCPDCSVCPSAPVVWVAFSNSFLSFLDNLFLFEVICIKNDTFKKTCDKQADRIL